MGWIWYKRSLRTMLEVKQNHYPSAMSEPTLFQAYIMAMSAADDARIHINYDQVLPPKEISSLTESLNQLTLVICRDRNYLAFITQSQYANVLAEILRTSHGAETMKALVDALTTATSFMLRTDQLPSPSNSNSPKATLAKFLQLRARRSAEPEGIVKEACLVINNLANAIATSSKALSSMFTTISAYNSAPEHRLNRVDDYKQTLGHLTRCFEDSPFDIRMTAINSIYRLGSLNSNHYGTYSASNVVIHPTFLEFDNAGRNWVRTYRTEQERKYAQNKLHTRRAIHETAKKVLECTQGAMRFIGDLVKPEDDGGYTSRTSALVTSVTKVTQSIEDVQSSIDVVTIPDEDAEDKSIVGVTASIGKIRGLLASKPRFAICGLMNTGKTSVINTLTGRPLLPVKDKGSTTSPTIIQHDESAIEPKLIIDKDHFTPCLKALRSWDVPGIVKKVRDLSKEQQEILYKFEQLDRDLKPRVSEFSSPEFHFKSEYTGTAEIISISESFNSLLRICKELAPAGERPNPSNSEFPRLLCRFSKLGLTLTDIEFVDLPGYNDTGAGENDGDIEQLYCIVMEKCQGVVLVERSARSAFKSRSGKRVCNIIKKHLEKEPKVLLGTFAEEHESMKWTKTDTTNMGMPLFYRGVGHAKTDFSERIIFCSPPLYTGSLFVRQLLEDRKKKQQEVHWEEVGVDDGATCLRWHSGQAAQKLWPKASYDDRVEIFDSAETISNMKNVPQHLTRFLFLEARDAECLQAMASVRDSLRALWKEQQGILDRSRDTGESLRRAREACKRFERVYESACGLWNSMQDKFNTKTFATMWDNLRNAKTKAEIALRDVLDAATESYNKYDDKIMFATREDACKFVDDAGLALKQKLDCIQDDLVVEVRKAAEEAWQTRIKDLASFITTMDAEIEPATLEHSLKETISVKLEELSSKRIQATVLDRVLAKRGSMSSSRKFLLEYTSPWWPRQVAEAEIVANFKDDAGKKQNPSKVEKAAAKRLLEELSDIRLNNGEKPTVERVQSAKGLSQKEAEKLYVETVNYLGFILRAPVLATIVECRSTDPKWSILDSKLGRGQPTTKTEGIQLELEKAREIFTGYVEKIWCPIVEKEAWQSLKGAITLSGGLGMNTILEFVNEQKERLDELERQCPLPLSKTEEEQLIVFQANFVSAFAAADELCNLLASDYSEIW
ncbi:hypothetical protein FRC18_008162 [Serendipita sp. 400]|nr:hypothetical protein FRC18_008162 [Serendipita sp. 400]